MRRDKNRCLILGGAGFIGVNLVSKLLAHGYSVRVFDRSASGRLNLASFESEIEFIEGDFLDVPLVNHVLQDVDFVFHLVGTTLPATSNEDPLYDVESNVLGTIRLLQACVHHNVKRLIFSSSGGTIYGVPREVPVDENHPTDPVCSYGITKLTIEKYLRLFHQLHGLDYTILRTANPYGKYQNIQRKQGAVGVFMACVREGKPITICGDGSVTRDYIYVEDVAAAFVKALSQHSQYRIFNIGTGVGTSLCELLAKIERVVGVRAEIEYAPVRVCDVPINVLNSTRAQEHMNWSVETDLDSGLRETYAWLELAAAVNSAGSASY